MTPCWVGLLALLLAAGASPARGAAKEHRTVTVTQQAYRGWPGAYRLSNGVADVVVVPQIGRIMAFHLSGQPETDPLWNNPALLGHAVPSHSDEWANFGGDKLWPSPQDDWGKHQPRAWPPDPTFEYGPFQVTRIPNGVRLTGPEVPNYAVQVVREITLTPGQASLTLRDRFLKSRSARGDKDGFPLGVWSVTQTRGDGTVYLPLNPQSIFGAAGYVPLGDSVGKPPASNWTVADHLLVVTRDPQASTKVGQDNTAGWIATLYGDVLFSEHFTRPPGRYPDKDTNTQVYTNAGGDAYIEMEVLGPLADLKAGQTLTRTMSWRLQRLPRTPRDAADARALVESAMK